MYTSIYICINFLQKSIKNSLKKNLSKQHQIDSPVTREKIEIERERHRKKRNQNNFVNEKKMKKASIWHH